MWTLCDKQSSFQFQIWWKNSRVENLLLWCQKYFSPTRPDTRAQRGTFKVIMRRWWGLLCWRQVKDKLKGSLSVLSTMMGWHEPVCRDVTWILRLGWHRGFVKPSFDYASRVYLRCWVCLLSVDLMFDSMKIILLTCHCLSSLATIFIINCVYPLTLVVSW